MPLVALTTKDGREIPLGEVDITRTIEDFGMAPADVAAIIANVRSRDDVGREQVTASQIGSGARQLFLEQTVDYAREPHRQRAAMLGTMKHGMLNIAHDGLRVEERVVSKSGTVSARYDSFVPSTGVLRDRKGVAFFKLLMVLKGGVLKEARDYVYQLNVTALILRQNGATVNEMWLDFEPTGVGKLEKKELEEKFSITDPSFVPVAVPFLPESEVWDAYERLQREKAQAQRTGKAPAFCTSTQTWGGKKCSAGWCAVAKECAALAAENGEAHPYIKPALDVQLKQSIAQAEAR